MQFNYFNISLLIGAVVGLLSALLIYYRHSRQLTNRSWFWLSLITTIWSLGYFTMITTDSFHVAKISNHILHAVAGFIPVLYLQFIAAITNRIDKLKKQIYISYIFSFIFLILNPTKLLLADVTSKFIFKYVSDAGPLFIFYTLHFFFWVIYAEIILLNSLRKATGLLRQQLKYVVWTTLVGFSGGASVFFLTFSPLLPPYPLILFSLYPIIITYAIVRYRLMDIRIVIIRSIVYFLLILYVAGLFAFLSFIAGKLLGEKTNINPEVVTLIIAFIIVIGLDPLKRILTRYTDMIFFKGRIDYSRVLRQLSEVIAREIKIQDLLDTSLKIITQELKVKNAIILLGDNKGKFYKPESFLNSRASVVLNEKNALIKYLKKNKDIIITEEFNRLVEDARTSQLRSRLIPVKQDLDQLDCALCSPIIIEHQLTALIIIGYKLSGDMFSKEDIRLFEVLTPQMAAALEKAKLYEEVQDFSETLKKKVEQRTHQLKQANRRLQKLDKAKSEFLSIAAHQLRTPLTGIKGYLSMLIDEDFGPLDEKQRKIMKSVFESSERLNRLVNVFLNISRIESGRLQLEKKPVVLEDLVQIIVNNFQLEAQKRKISLEFIKPKRKTRAVIIDQDKITDVINNLIDNAIKYTEKGGIKVQVKPEENQVVLSVTDTGIGIAQEELSEMFNKFSRTSVSERMNTGGSGLGLYIAKRLLEAHGGQVWVESPGRGKGSTFTFALPVK